MTERIVPEEHKNGNIQVGLPFHCPTCGATVTNILHYSDYCGLAIHSKPLDKLGRHLDYLDCPGCGKCTRVARLGDTILPFEWPAGIDGQGEADLINALLRQIVQEVGPQGEADPAASVVYRLLAGTTAPEPAIQEIRALVDGNGEKAHTTTTCSDCGVALRTDLSPLIPGVGHVCYDCLIYYVGRPIFLSDPEMV